METRTKVLGAAIATGLLYAFTRPKMEIKVLKADNRLGMLQYFMKYYDFTITDTFILGDEPNIVPVGDGKHFFLVAGNPVTGIVDLAIGFYTPEQAFQAINAKVISFDVAGNAGISGKDYPALREVEVTYSNGRKIGTSMAAHLTDSDIYEYFKIGRKFNIGNGENDLIASVADVKIIK